MLTAFVLSLIMRQQYLEVLMGESKWQYPMRTISLCLMFKVNPVSTSMHCAIRLTLQHMLSMIHVLLPSEPDPKRPRPEPHQTCRICGGYARVPFQRCQFCGDSSSWHHGRCCPGRHRPLAHFVLSQGTGNPPEYVQAAMYCCTGAGARQRGEGSGPRGEGSGKRPFGEGGGERQRGEGGGGGRGGFGGRGPDPGPGGIIVGIWIQCDGWQPDEQLLWGRFNPEITVRVLLRSALRQVPFQYRGNLAEAVQGNDLCNANGDQLDKDMSLHAAGVRDGDTLSLSP